MAFVAGLISRASIHDVVMSLSKAMFGGFVGVLV